MPDNTHHFPRERLPDEVYVVFDAAGMPHIFTDIEKCPVHFRPGVGIRIAIYKLSDVKRLDIEFTFVKEE